MPVFRDSYMRVTSAIGSQSVCSSRSALVGGRLFVLEEIDGSSSFVGALFVTNVPRLLPCDECIPQCEIVPFDYNCATAGRNQTPKKDIMTWCTVD